MCILFFICIHCTLLKLVCYYDLSVLSMSVMCFQKKVWTVVGSIQFYLGFLEFV